MIEALLLVTVGPGVRVVIPEPTFTLYALMTSILGGEAVRVTLGPKFEYERRRLAARTPRGSGGADDRVHAQQSDGGVLPLGAIEDLCADGDGLVVIDEAYHEFAGVSAVPLLERHANLIVLRTFSKAMSMAGLRLGYLLAAPALVREVNKARLPYNVNFFTQVAALAALSERDILDASVAGWCDCATRSSRSSPICRG